MFAMKIHLYYIGPIKWSNNGNGSEHKLSCKLIRSL